MTEMPGNEGVDSEREVLTDSLLDPEPEPRPAEDAERPVEEAVVHENAATSLDQPSEDVS